MTKPSVNVTGYLRQEMMPTVWCPGCGHGIIAHGLAKALADLGLDKDQVAYIGGIGCSGRLPFYFDGNAMHTTHGRALAFATGLKLANPGLTVIAAMGDGDTMAIGGNHFIHAARRNIDITAIVMNNAIYGMTGGQGAPTTPLESRSMTSLLGWIEPPFDTVALALAAGATFVARTTTFDFQEMPELIARGIRHHGFSVIEVMSQCPTYYGRLNKLGEAPEMLLYERDRTKLLESFGPPAEVTREELVGQLPIGLFRDEERPEYVDQYHGLVARAGGHNHAS